MTLLHDPDKKRTNLESTIIKIVGRAEEYYWNNRESILSSDSLDKHYLPEWTKDIENAINDDGMAEASTAEPGEAQR